MSDEEEFVNNGKYLGGKWSDGWDKRNCRINGRGGGGVGFDIRIEYINSIPKSVVS